MPNTLINPKAAGKNFGNKINNNNSTSNTTYGLSGGVDSSDMSGYMQAANAGISILGDLFYDTNNYALNFNYLPILPGIGNREAILNNNITYKYQPIDNVSGGEVLSDFANNTISGFNSSPYLAGLLGIGTLIGKHVKHNKISAENALGYDLVASANARLNLTNQYALEQTDLYNNFLELKHMAERGGNLNTHGATFDNGMTYFNVGGTHGLNPYGGILQGFNQEDGEPNLVELGETKWNDYIFSNRYKAGGSLLKKYLLPEDYAGMTFADISKKLSEPLEDTPGSMIEKRTTDTMLSRLMEAQEEKRTKDAENQAIKEFKKGGHMFPNGGEEDELFPWKIPSIVDVEQNPELLNPNNSNDDYFIGPPQFDENQIRQWLILDTIDKYKYGKNYTPERIEYTPIRSKFNPRYLTLLDNFASVLGDKLGITNQPDYGRSRMIRDAASNITNADTITPYLQRYIPKEIPIQSLMNNYRSMLAADIARANNTTNANIVAAQALANDATNKYYDSLGQALIDATQYNNQENARASQINNASELQLAQLLQNNSQFNAQQGIHRYNALKDYIDDLSMQDQLASAAQQGNLNTWREGLQNYLMEREDKDVIAKLINSGALRYDKNSGAFYLDNDYLSQYV